MDNTMIDPVFETDKALTMLPNNALDFKEAPQQFDEDVSASPNKIEQDLPEGNTKNAKIGKLYISKIPIFAYMLKIKLNSAEIQILSRLHEGPTTIRQLGKDLGRSPSWMSRCLSHMEGLGLLEVRKERRTATVTIPSSVLGSRLLTYLRGSTFPNSELVLKGLGLKILPLLLPVGSSAKEIVQACSVSKRTIASYLRFFKTSGIITVHKRIYRINQRHQPLIELVRAFSEHVNIKIAASLTVPHAMLWQGRDEFLVSVDRSIDQNHYHKAADTALDEYGVGILHRSEYYLYSPHKRKISKAEALVQAFVIDMNEPRMARLLRTETQSDERFKDAVLLEARRYDIEAAIQGVLTNVRA